MDIVELINGDPVWKDIDELSLPLPSETDKEYKDVLFLRLAKIMEYYTLVSQFEPQALKTVATIKNAIHINEMARQQIVHYGIADIDKIPNIHRSNIQKTIAWIECSSALSDDISQLDSDTNQLRNDLVIAENDLFEIQVRKDVADKVLRTGISILSKIGGDE